MRYIYIIKHFLKQPTPPFIMGSILIYGLINTPHTSEFNLINENGYINKQQKRQNDIQTLSLHNRKNTFTNINCTFS
jgi:hypothetical protein